MVTPMLSMAQIYPNVACLCRGKTRKSMSFENMNRRTAEQGTAEYRSKKHYFTPLRTSVVRNSLFDIVLRTPHPAGGSPVSMPKIGFEFGILVIVICLIFGIWDLGFGISLPLVASSQHMCRLPYSPFS